MINFIFLVRKKLEVLYKMMTFLTSSINIITILRMCYFINSLFFVNPNFLIINGPNNASHRIENLGGNLNLDLILDLLSNFLPLMLNTSQLLCLLFSSQNEYHL